jgi:hypothetical protein
VILIAVNHDPDYWFRLITRLERVMSLDEMARKVGSSAPSLCRYKAGIGEPRWTVALKLVALDEANAIHSANGMPPLAKLGNSLAR